MDGPHHFFVTIPHLPAMSTAEAIQTYRDMREGMPDTNAFMKVNTGLVFRSFSFSLVSLLIDDCRNIQSLEKHIPLDQGRCKARSLSSTDINLQSSHTFRGCTSVCAVFLSVFLAQTCVKAG